MSNNIEKLDLRIYHNLNVFAGQSDRQQLLSNHEVKKLLLSAYEMTIEILLNSNSVNDHIYHEQANLVLSIQANPNYGLPLGPTQKFIFNLVVQEMKNTNSPVIRLGKIYSNLCRNPELLNIENHKIYLLDQVLKLFSTQIYFIYQDNLIIKKIDFWWNPLKIKKKYISASSTVVVTKELFNILLG